MLRPKEVQVQYFAVLREQRGLSNETCSSEAQSPRQLYEELAKLHGFTLPINKLQVAINEEFSSWDSVLKAGDVVVFIPPVAGG